jgi:uncharacterized protein (DUF488 family)
MQLMTIGFTQKAAERFFELLASNGVDLLLDVRLNPDGQLSGFAKRGDLPFFLRRLVNSDYLHLPILAPTQEIMSDVRKDHDWATYTSRFEALMDERGVPDALDRAMFEGHTCCLLCSEAKPNECHRQLIAERLKRVWGDVEVVHLI